MEQTRNLASVRVDYPAPNHIPKDRLVDLSFAMGTMPNDLIDPYEPCGWLADPAIPRLLYEPINPNNPARGLSTGYGGTWVVSHYEDIDRVYTDNEHFSNKGTAEFQRMIGETFRSIPLAIDPPEHNKYRLFLMPHFSPKRMNAMQDHIRSVVVDMIDEIAAKGEVDMAWDFGRIFPVRIFMGLMNFPPEMLESFLDWEWDILHSNDVAKIQSALRNVLGFLRGFMAEKVANPDDGLVSSIVHGKIEGKDISDDDKIGMVWFLWLGGLDTVAATISHMFRRMAMQPEIQTQLRADPSLIPTAVEEFLRTQPILSSGRSAKKDFEWHGVHIKAGENVRCLNPAGNFDPARFENPREFDPARKANRHFTFVAGVHLCLGAPLARRELRILLEEWFKRIPEFRPKPGADTSIFPWLMSIRNLPLVWETR
jgi:cytochrome P450